MKVEFISFNQLLFMMQSLLLVILVYFTNEILSIEIENKTSHFKYVESTPMILDGGHKVEGIMNMSMTLHGYGMTRYQPYLVNDNTEISESRKLQGDPSRYFNDLCKYGTEWVISTDTNQCSEACKIKLDSKCAGDYPDFLGWPQSQSDILEVLLSMNSTLYPEVSQCLSDDVTTSYIQGQDDRDPQIDVRAESCVIYFRSISETNSGSEIPFYVCDPIRFRSVGGRLCPCCKSGKIFIISVYFWI